MSNNDCVHCRHGASIQWYGFWLCDPCKEQATISHYWDHGIEVTLVCIGDERYVNRPVYSINPKYELTNNRSTDTISR